MAVCLVVLLGRRRRAPALPDLAAGCEERLEQLPQRRLLDGRDQCPQVLCHLLETGARTVHQVEGLVLPWLGWTQPADRERLAVLRVDRILRGHPHDSPRSGG